MYKINKYLLIELKDQSRDSEEGHTQSASSTFTFRKVEVQMVYYGTFGRILSRLLGMNAQDSLVSRHITAQFRWQVGRGQNVIDPL